MLKRVILTVALLSLVSCTPQTKQTQPEPRHEVTKQEKLNPVIELPQLNKSTEKPKNPTKTPTQSPNPTNTVSQVEKNLINHMLKKKVPESRAKEYASLIVKFSNKHQVDPYTILAMMEVESNYNPNLVGDANDTGLLQILPATQRYMGIKGNLFDPAVNIEVGAKYLAYNQKRFGRDLGIVAYNQGEGNVARGTYKTWYLTKVKKVLATIER
jgi:soluble lytic murein transglycosylase-like protein